MKLSKKAIAGMVTIAFAVTSVTPAFAQTMPAPQNEAAPQVVMMDASEMDMSVPAELVGMDRFLSKDAQGCIQLDVEAALAAGYVEQSVMGVKGHLDNINEQVLAGRLYVDSTFTAYSANNQRLVPRGYLTGDREDGYTGVLTYWYGATFIYCNKKEAPLLYKSFVNTTSRCNAAIDYLSALSDDMDMNNQPDAQYAQNALDCLIVGASVIGLTAYVYSTYIKNAMGNDTGIIWSIQQDFNTGTIGWAFGSQDWDAIDPDLIRP